MAYFAKLDNNTVIDIHGVSNNELMVNGVEVEDQGIAFLTDWSGAGHTYDAQRDESTGTWVSGGSP